MMNYCTGKEYPLSIEHNHFFEIRFNIAMHWLTRLNIRLTAKLVGDDEFGNRYYESKKPRSHGRKSRYVIFNGKAEASKVPADWHGWLHHTEASPPPPEGYSKHSWQLPHQPNLTGTVHAYKPAGHLLRLGKRRKATGDYQPWKPE